MGNATDDTKAIANHITDTHDNSGVAQVIEQFILNA
jgi:hydroxymethylpyrimidine pyrophosphatase-like HAD family hydrolase